MKVIIIGAGEVGYHIADILSKEKQDVILIDRNEERLKELAETLDVMTLHGSGSSPEILKKAGLSEADMVVAVTDSDETNMVACLLASTQSRVSFKIARIRNPELDEYADIFGKDRLNINLCINPEREAVKIALDLIEFPGATEVMDFHDGRIKLIGFPIQSSSVTGKTLQQLREIHPNSKMLITSIIRDDKLIEPKGDSVIRENDFFFAVAAAAEAKVLLRIFWRKTDPTKRIVIMGGGNTGRMLAEALEGKGLTVKIIEKRKDRCRFSRRGSTGSWSFTATERARISSWRRTSGTWTSLPQSPTTRKTTSWGRSSRSAWGPKRRLPSSTGSSTCRSSPSWASTGSSTRGTPPSARSFTSSGAGRSSRQHRFMTSGWRPSKSWPWRRRRSPANPSRTSPSRREQSWAQSCGARR
jgi:Trk K+ transport system NAD-binding subunit